MEDDDNDSLFFQRALARLEFTGAYRRVSTVEATIDYLSGAGEFADRHLFPSPDVLVLDSSLSGATTTSDLLAWLDGNELFGHVVRIVLSGGVSPEKKRDWLESGVRAVLMKGTSLAEFAAAVEQVLRRCVP